MIKKSIFRVLTAITLILAMNINAEAQLSPRKPTPAPANTLTLSDTKVSLAEGATKTLTVTGLPSGEKATWTTSSSSIATVSNGKITAVKAGTATITATAGSKKATCEVTVTAKVVSNLTLSETFLPLTKGQSKKITVKSGLAAGEKPTWKSSSPNVATVDSEGNIKALEVGKTTITATVNGKEGKCDVSVYIPITQTQLGRGINIFGAATFSTEFIKGNYPIIDIDKLLVDNPARVVQNKDIASDAKFTIATGKSVSEVVNSLNSKNSVGYDGAFSVSADVNFDRKKTENRINMFAKVKGTVVVMKELITTPTPVSSLVPYLTQGFTTAVKSVTNTADAKKMMERYGTHVIVDCNWGGVVDMDIIYTSTKITSASTLETTITGSIAGFKASSSTTTTSNRDDFRENNNTTIVCRGGSAEGATITSIEQFESKYTPWVASIKNGTNIVACGIDDEECLILLSDIVAVVDASKKKFFEEAFKEMQLSATSTLNNIKIGIPVLTKLERLEHVGSSASDPQTIPTGYNHAVLNDRYDMNNANTQNILNISQFGDGVGKSLAHMYYQTRYLTNSSKDPSDKINGNAISQITVYGDLDKRPSQYADWKTKYEPYGWVDPNIDLNKGCGSGSASIWLIYRTATAKDEYVIDHIGGMQYKQEPSDVLLAPNSEGKWDWVRYEQDRDVRGTKVKKGDIARLDLQCGNAWGVRMVVHYVKIKDVETANK